MSPSSLESQCCHFDSIFLSVVILLFSCKDYSLDTFSFFLFATLQILIKITETMSVCLSVCLSVSLSVCLSVCLSMCLCMCLHPYAYLSACGRACYFQLIHYKLSQDFLNVQRSMEAVSCACYMSEYARAELK